MKTELRTIILLALLLGLAACAPENKSTQTLSNDPKISANVIYGSDGRLDVYQLTDDRLKKLAASTVALIKNSSISSSTSSSTILGKNFGSQMNLCASEKYFEQDTAAFCSGSLVGADLVLTAGHCIETLADCESTRLVFDFAVKAIGVLPKQIPNSEIYKCKEIVKTIRNNSGQDFAVIRLDKPVTNHPVLKLRRQGELSVGEELTVIGHPVGLPTKITSGGKVRSISNSEYIVASVDTYGGNSGSAVFNAQTGLIEGILVRGEQDFEQRGSCYVSKTCLDDSCRGEDVTRISMARTYIPETDSGDVTPPAPPVLKPEVFTKTVNINIPDNKTIGVTSVLAVASVPNKRKVIISVDITHPYIGDLSIVVTAPNGKAVTIHNRAGGAVSGLKKSYDVTSALGAVAVSGNYKIVVKDLAARDLGVFKSWGVEFR